LEEERQLLINEYNLFGLLNINSILNHEKLSIPLKDGQGIGFILPPITTNPMININDNYKNISFINTGQN